MMKAQYKEYDDLNLYENELEFGNLVLPGLNNWKYMVAFEPDQQPKEEVIQGILRKGRKMLISGPSKSAKSCLLLELAIAVTEGKPWMGFPCRKGNVLYINMELPPDTVQSRLREMHRQMGTEPDPNEILDSNDSDLCVWNLRGYSQPLSKLANPIVRACLDCEADMVIIDPIYKVMEGDENSASSAGELCNILDWIAREADCAVVFCHHHSKGAKGNRQVLDRSSGSGVFARDPDAILDMIQLDPPASSLEKMGGGAVTAWRMEAVLREFPAIDPINCWFRFPLHTVDTEGVLDEIAAVGSSRANLYKSGKRNVNKEEMQEAFHKAFEALCKNGRPVSVTALADKLNVTPQTIRNRVKELSDVYWLENKMVGKLDKGVA